MAELAVKTRPGSNYADGDILCCFNNRRIRCAHAQHICHVKMAARNAFGLILPTEVAHDWFENVCEFKFERVSRKEIKRILLSDMSEETLSDVPNAKGEAMDVPLFIELRKRATGKHYLFGEVGAEFWYGGKTDVSNANMDLVWTAIEAKTPLLEADHKLWPLGSKDKTHHLFFAIDNLSDARANALVVPDLDETDPDNPIIISKRLHHVNWRNDLGLSARTVADVEDRDVEVLTDPLKTRDESTITRTKAR